MGAPSADAWLAAAKAAVDPDAVGMYLMHNGVVRGTSRSGEPVTGMDLAVDRERMREVLDDARRATGVAYVDVWINEGRLEVGDDIMYVIVAGDIRPNVIEGLTALVARLKGEVVTEVESR